MRSGSAILQNQRWPNMFIVRKKCMRLNKKVVPPHLNHSISSKRLGVWSYCFVTLFYAFPIQKCLLPPISRHVCCHDNHATFRLIFENSNLQFFQVFPPERNFLWANLLCFGHHNPLRILIEANIRSVTVERSKNTFCPNMVINAGLTD